MIKKIHKIVLSFVAVATLGACGGESLALLANGIAAGQQGGNNQVQPNVDFDNARFVSQEIDRMRLTMTAQQRFNGTSRYDGYVRLDKFFTNADAFGELITQIDFGNERVSMTTGDFVVIDDNTGRFIENTMGGLSMTDGRFEDVNGALAFRGTLRGAIAGGAVRANIGANFYGQGGSAQGFEGTSLSGSSHQVSVNGID